VCSKQTHSRWRAIAWLEDARTAAAVIRQFIDPTGRHAIAPTALARIARKIEELEAMRATLRDLVARCHGDDRPDCPILDDLAGNMAGKGDTG